MANDPGKAEALEQEREDAQRAAMRREKFLTAKWPTEEEDAVITSAALTDPDNPPLEEGDIVHFKPARLFGAKPDADNVVVQSKKPPR